MRVLITTPDLNVTGGVSNYFKVLRPFLEGVADYHYVGIRSGETSAARMVLRLFSDYGRFALALTRRRYDLIHINTAFAPRAFPRDVVFFWLARMLRRRVVVFVRGGDPGCLRTAWTRLFRFAYGPADAFIVLAKDHVTKLREFGYAGKIACETTVASPDVFSAAPARGERRGSRFRILFLARLEKEKGLYEAIEAYRLVKQRGHDTELVIAGAGAESEGARRYIAERGIRDVSFLGHVAGKAKTKAYTDSQLYIFASHFEGMPNSVLEAMACGLPVVTRRVGGLADFFEDGRMGFSTDSRDPEILAQLVERIILDPGLAARVGKHNRAYAEQHFAAPVVATRLMRIYSGVIGHPLVVPSKASHSA